MKLWFKAKRYGWGWTPISIEGWIVTAVYVWLLVTTFLKVDAAQHSNSDTLIGFAVPFIAYTLVFLGIAYQTGEHPHWSWGDSNSQTGDRNSKSVDHN